MNAEKASAGKSCAVEGVDDLFEESTAAVRKLQTDEIVIGLCAPAGSPVHKVADELKRLLVQRYGYECQIIRLSKLIEEVGGPVESTSRFERIQKLIDKGNDLRRRFGYSILADLAISRIASAREKVKIASKEPRYSGRRICYIVDSIKNSEELDILRLVYREMFYFMGVFAPLHVRQKELEAEGMALEQVHKIIDRDSGEELDHGQLVRATFPLADFFLRSGAGSDKELTLRLERFLDLILRARLTTPTYAETAMYQAASAAGNSACLSRQVGAAVTDAQGDLLAIGWNDVPQFGGGLYASEVPVDGRVHVLDNRCYNWKGGKCWNDQEKGLLAQRVIDTLVVAKIVSVEDRSKGIDALKNSSIRSLIEYSRSIHAEMHALLAASQIGGQRVRGGKVFCTTYPCHACARHIVAAGIREVYYIEPYRKSLATKLHDDAITEDEETRDKVRILPFDGVSPRRYLDLFQMGTAQRKKNGVAVQHDPRRVRPVASGMLESVPALEGLVVQSLVSRKLLQG
jgi:deoxycytidylate deaminase